MDCEDLTTVIVSSNGTFSTTSYWDFGNGCEVDYLATGTWENLGSSVYSTTEDGDTFTQEISFDGNEMYFDFIDEGVIYTDVFVRL